MGSCPERGFALVGSCPEWGFVLVGAWPSHELSHIMEICPGGGLT